MAKKMKKAVSEGKKPVFRPLQPYKSEGDHPKMSFDGAVSAAALKSLLKRCSGSSLSWGQVVCGMISGCVRSGCKALTAAITAGVAGAMPFELRSFIAFFSCPTSTFWRAALTAASGELKKVVEGVSERQGAMKLAGAVRKDQVALKRLIGVGFARAWSRISVKSERWCSQIACVTWGHTLVGVEGMRRAAVKRSGSRG